MKKFITIMVLVIIVIGTGIWIRSSRISSNKVVKIKKETEIKKYSEIEQSIDMMILKYNAIVNWHQTLNDTILFPKVYTIQLEHEMIRPDARPILFFATVDDIVKLEGKYYMYLKDETYDIINHTIYYVLECDSNHINKIINNEATSFDIFNQYGVISLITLVQKPILGITSNPINDMNAELSIESSNVLIAKGRCLDLMYVGDNFTSIKEHYIKQ